MTKGQKPKMVKHNRNKQRSSPNNFILETHRTINYTVVGAGGQININFFP